MKFPIILLLSVLMCPAIAAAQVNLVADSYFPAELEFREMQKVLSDETIDEPSHLPKVDGAPLLLDMGLSKYARRIYSTGNTGSLSIEVVTLRDFRAAYSILTLLRDSSIQNGPPGDAFTVTGDGIRFAQEREWVRIQGRDVSSDLIKRVANSISNRIGPVRHSRPSLLNHLPKLGCDPASLRYFPGLKSYESFSGPNADKYFVFNSDMEIAQAHYSLENRTGVLSLLNFPTPQVAEEYYAELAPKDATKNAKDIFAKRTGPIVAILEGTFDARAADKILSSIKFSYSIRWIYEKRNKPTIIWGVPASILGTVVKSLLFVVLLCVVSVAAGAGFAIFRFLLRGYAPQNPLDRPERTEITTLRLR